MKKVLITALLVSLALGAFAQAIDTSMIDVSKAELNLAGPDSVYITNIYYGGARVSVLLKYNDGTGATIYGPYSDADKLLLDSFELGEASIRQTSRDTLVISDLILYGSGVSGRLKYDGVYTLDLTSWWQQAETPVTAEAQVATLTAQIATAQTRYEQELTATKAKFANDIAEAAADSAEAIAELEADVKAAEAEIKRLESRIAMGGGGMAATPGAAAGSSIDPRSVDISQLDVSGAMMHLAGPDTIYVTDIEYGGVAMSILLKYDGKQGALIYGPYFDENKLLLDSFELGYAKLRLQGNDTLVISDLLLYGTGVSGRFAYDGVYTLNLENWWQTSGPMTSEMRIAALEAQADTTALMASITAAEAERDAALADLASAEADLAEAMADLEAAKAENDRLALRLSMGGGGMAATPGAAAGSSIDPRSVDISQLDLSDSMMHLAGPDTIYLTDIEYGGVPMSVLLKYDGKQGALIYGPYFDDNKLLLDSFELGYANVRLQGNDTLIISDLILYGTGVSGRFEYDGVYTLNLSSWWETMTPKTNEMTIAELESQMDAAERRYERELAAASTKIAGLERQLASGAGVAMVEKPTRTTVTGLSSGSSILGNWNMSGGNLTQSNSALLYAKYGIPMSQSNNQTLYSFTAQASASGTAFVGYGLHIVASGDRAANSYGYGDSYLIWVTRDPSYYKNNNTYIQVYRSYDDIKMLQVASVATDENIARSSDVEILYNKVSGLITVWINGNLYVTYNAPSPIQSGNKVAFRTLGGPVTFSDFDVKVQ